MEFETLSLAFRSFEDGMPSFVLQPFGKESHWCQY